MKDGKFSHNNTVAPVKTGVLELLSLKGRTAIISGGGAGIGYAVAQGLAEVGANVVIWYNSNKEAVEKAKAIEDQYGVKCEYGLQNLGGILAESFARQSISSGRA